MILHTGATIYLIEWDAAIRADVYKVGDALIANAAKKDDGTPAMDYIRADLDCDYIATRTEDRFAEGSVFTFKAGHVIVQSDAAKERMAAA